MRRLLVLEHLSLDGVLQGPGGPDEDPSGGFSAGGWAGAYGDPELGRLLGPRMAGPFDLLLGRRTFEIWEAYWPLHADGWPAAQKATKYVVSSTRTTSSWSPTVFLDGDLSSALAKLKAQPGPDLHLWGSGHLLQSILPLDVIDAFWLMVYPLVLGRGKRLFAEGTVPTSFRLETHAVTPKGVLCLQYERGNPR